MALIISFSHDYPKLHGQKRARLLAVDITKRSDLHPDLVEYDTVFEGGRYPLPNGLLLVLTFAGEKRIPFTTIRRATAVKQEYYERNIGQWFGIVINTVETEKPVAEQLVADL